ncbi:MAG TPA: cation diffusion facilitator family transporter [Chitinophagaceae bacterium]|nr:cation diffusion facilitator family transporter [Chitinophagaceae bacterium]
MKAQTQNLQVQKWVAAISVLLLAVKFIAYYLTHSVSILTDALESIVNVAAGFIGLYSLYIAAKPRDIDHPYGHGKAEFISAAIEGTLITSAGAIIIYKAIRSLITPVELQKLDYGIYLVAAAGVINYIVGFITESKGQKSQSLALTASGRHLKSDSYSTFGIIAGLILIYFTDLMWIDPAVAIIVGIIIIYTGYKILRKSIAGIMDEADIELLKKIVDLLNKNKRENWVDLHNLRVIKYGSILHIDCHLTVPWYLNVNEAHAEVEALSSLVRNEFGESVELFVHVDGCLPFSCKVCNKQNCNVRKHNFEKRIDWTLQNVLQDQKHRL